VALAFRFGRFVLFASLSLVPSAAWLLHTLVTCLRQDGKGMQRSARTEKILAKAAGLVLTGLMGFLCWRVAMVPYLPGNPCRPARPVVRELLSFDSFSQPLAKFMKEHQLEDRVLSGWSLSPYLMWHMPEIRLFMDTRDQSYYPAKVVRDYFTIMGIVPAPDSEALDLLDRYDVATVALSTGPIDFELATKLMLSKKWACLYTDPYAILLVRSDAPRFRAMLKSADFAGLRFPDAISRTLSEATLSFFLLGQIRPGLVKALKEQAMRAPWPNYYALICWGSDDPRTCFSTETTGFLVSEANRLSTISPFFSNGAEHITDSLTTLYEILEQNALRCGDPVRANSFHALKQSSRARYRQIRRYYLGAVF